MERAFVFLAGLCVGSFLNVVIYRLNHGLSPLRGRSFCPRCKRKIAWFDNLPLVSYIFLRGRCRFCQAPISLYYPLVELATAILFVVSTFLVFSSPAAPGASAWLELGYFWLVMAALVIVFVSDLRYGTIPDQVVYPLVVLTLFWLVLTRQPLVNHLLAGLGGLGFFWVLVLLTREKGMGWGDVKLAGGLGLLLGWPLIGLTFYLAFLTGGMVGVILILLRKKRFQDHLPFGPFLVGATLFSLFWGKQILGWLIK